MGLFGRKKRSFFTQDQQQTIVQAIREAETATSGELRVFVESRCAYVDAMDRAKEVFFKLEMEHTELRNGVLIYVALDDHQIAIFGDEGIYQKTEGDPYWVAILDRMRAFFRQGDVADGIADAAITIGRTLSQHFPYDPKADKNELPDEIAFGR